MDIAIVLLLPLLAGYFFSKYWIVTKFRTPRESGHHLYFKSSIIGVVLFLIVGVLHLILLKTWSFYLETIVFFSSKIDGMFDSQNTNLTSAFLVSILTFFSSFILWKPCNLIFEWYAKCQDEINQESLGNQSAIPYYLRKAVQDDDIAHILISAAIREMSIMVTTDSKKVYVGYVTNTIDPSAERKAFSLIPVMSGFRDDKHQIIFTTDYSFVHDDIKDKKDVNLDDLDVDDFIVTIPLDKLSSLRFFDSRAYKKFNSKF